MRLLEDALAVSIDQLIESASPDARRLLWIIALANEPVTLRLFGGVWSGESAESEQLRQMKALLDNLSSLLPEVQENLKEMPPELRAQIDALPLAPSRPDPVPLLNALEAVGLANGEREGPADGNSDYSCHELLRERIRRWMELRSQDRGEFSANGVRLAFAERLQHVFDGLKHENLSAALEAGARAVVYCAQAGAYDRLGEFAGEVITGIRDPRLLERLIPHLEAAAASAPEGPDRWMILLSLADALHNSGRAGKSLSYYEEAAKLARAAAEAGGERAREAWAGLAVIVGNWAGALITTGNLAAAREQHLASAEAERRAGRPEVNVESSEMEALRINIMQGDVAGALPQANVRLAKLQNWWQRWRRGEPVPEAPEREALARALISGLDVVMTAQIALKQWESALSSADDMLSVERESQRPPEIIAATRLNRTGLLIRLKRFDEAKQELDACLEIFASHPTERATVLSTLADLYDKLGDILQAITQERRALALRDTLPHPSDRVISHNNLANYLIRSRDPSLIAEADRHRLASISYRLCANLQEHLRTNLRNYVIDFRRDQATGTQPASSPPFRALRRSSLIPPSTRLRGGCASGRSTSANFRLGSTNSSPTPVRPRSSRSREFLRDDHADCARKPLRSTRDRCARRRSRPGRGDRARHRAAHRDGRRRAPITRAVPAGTDGAVGGGGRGVAAPGRYSRGSSKGDRARRRIR